ncbi:MAG TPA: response regulator [Rhodanobacteraceae bacterium]|jgi:two-component system response regulator|nr:response regulator [Rhodanobacteraceae bacterium]
MTDHRVDILLVEDSVADAEMTLRTLKRRGVANGVEWVRDGVEAVEYLFSEGKYANRKPGMPKLVLLDLKMPRMDGMQVLARMKEQALTKAVPVVMMTSSREEGDVLASYALGVNSYVVKPVDFNDFAETVVQVGLYWLVANEAVG